MIHQGLRREIDTDRVLTEEYCGIETLDEGGAMDRIAFVTISS